MSFTDRDRLQWLRGACAAALLCAVGFAQGLGGGAFAGESTRGVPTLLEESLDQMMMRAARQAVADPFFDAGPALQRLYPPGWQAIDPSAAEYQGFPSLTPKEFGAFPGGTFAVPFETDVELPPPLAINLPKAPNSWPSWFPDEGAEPGGFRADVGILAQASDYVWVRETGAKAFVPLEYWDRFRVINTGAAIDVRGDGQFVLVFHDGARVRVWGTTRMVLGELIPEWIELGLDNVTRMIGFVADRPLRLRLGHAGTVEALATRFWIEPDQGFVSVENRGPGSMRLQSPERDVEVPPGHRIRVVLAGDADTRVDAPLELRGGLQVERDGNTLRVDAGEEGGVVTWSGARLRVPRGTTLRLDPLAGAEFPENRQGAQTK